MSKIKKLKKRFTAFVNELTPDQVREQLVFAYLQMEKCQQVLKGEDVEPIEMMDNGESSDLELFYRCKKVADELAYLNKMVHENKKVGSLVIEVTVDVSNLKNNIGKIDTRKLEDELDSLRVRDYLKPNSAETFRRFREEFLKFSKGLRNSDKSESRFKKGQEVWYMFGDRVQHSTIEYPMRDVDGVTIYKTKLGHSTAECETFVSLEELMENLKKTVNE